MRVLLPPPRGVVTDRAPADELERWMSEWLETEVSVSYAASYARLEESILADAVELAWAPPVVCCRVRHWVRAIFTAVRAGVGCGVAALLVRHDDPVCEVAELEGKRAAWIDPLSLSGYLAGRALLLEEGFASTRFFESERFLGTYRDALIAVASGEADVTSIYGRVGQSDTDVLDGAVDLAGLRALKLRVLRRTAPFPYDALVATRALDDDALERIGERLLSIRRVQGPSKLLDVCNADAFQATDAEAYDALTPLLDLGGR